MSPAGNAPALPSDLLHGLALRPPVAAWDGLRYRGSVPLHARLQDAQAMAGVVAAVQRGHFLGVVAVAPVHARQAAAGLALPGMTGRKPGPPARPVLPTGLTEPARPTCPMPAAMSGAWRRPCLAKVSHAQPCGAWTAMPASGCRPATPTCGR